MWNFWTKRNKRRNSGSSEPASSREPSGSAGHPFSPKKFDSTQIVRGTNNVDELGSGELAGSAELGSAELGLSKPVRLRPLGVGELDEFDSPTQQELCTNCTNCGKEMQQSKPRKSGYRMPQKSSYYKHWDHSYGSRGSYGSRDTYDTYDTYDMHDMHDAYDAYDAYDMHNTYDDPEDSQICEDCKRVDLIKHEKGEEVQSDFVAIAYVDENFLQGQKIVFDVAEVQDLKNAGVWEQVLRLGSDFNKPSQGELSEICRDRLIWQIGVKDLQQFDANVLVLVR